MPNVAALDCGSNSTRLLITSAAGVALEREMTITRLSEGVDASGALTEAAMERTLNALHRYRSLMDAHEVDRGLLVATSAVRDAANGATFLARAADVTGVVARCISGVEEARLSLQGACASLAPASTPTLILDIGGGSSEIATEGANGTVGFSMQVGCVRVTERALGTGVVTPDGARAAEAMVQTELDRAFETEPTFAALVGGVRLVGLAGTVATLAQLTTGLATYERAAVHHVTVSRSDVQYWYEELGRRTPAERLAVPGMIPGREDVLVAGLVILGAVMDRFACDSLLTSEDDILDGVAMLLRGADQNGTVA